MNFRWQPFVLSCLLVCSAGVCLISNAQAAEQESESARAPAADSDRWHLLARRIDSLRRQSNVPAAGLIVLDRGQIVLLETFGSVDETTPFRWGSISKSFTALGALKAVSESATRLNDPVRGILSPPSYINPWRETEPLKIVHLLELTAGLGDLSREEFTANEPLPLNRALANNADRSMLWPPGLQHSYSNVPPGLTAAVIESLSGQDFDTYMAKKIFAPLAMTSASFQPVKGLPGGFAEDGRREIPYWHVTFRAFGGLNASVSDMGRFLTALLNADPANSGQALDFALVDRMFTPTSSAGARAGLAISYGAGAYAWVSNGQVFWGHGGDADGYRSRYGLLRDRGRGYLLVINTDNPSLLRRLQRTVESELTADLSGPPGCGIKSTTSANRLQTDLTRFAGDYYPASTRFRVAGWRSGALDRATVSVTNAKLSFARKGRVVTLEHCGGGLFRRPADPAPTAVFFQADNGVLYLQGELGNFLNLSTGNCPGFLDLCHEE